MFANGDRYEGQWVKNLKSGQGIIYYISGAKFEGEWQDDKATGNG